MNWSRWYTGEPNGGNNENYIMLVPLSNSWILSDYWNDAYETGNETDLEITVICVAEKSSNKTCEDIDECENFDCGEGICKNDIGSRNCTCNAGFINEFYDQSAICGEYYY